MTRIFYYSVSEKELKKSLASGEGKNKDIYSVVKHGNYANFYLALLAIALFSICVGILAMELTTVQLVVSVFAIVILYQAAMSEYQYSKFFAGLVAPYFSKFLSWQKKYTKSSFDYYEKNFSSDSDSKKYDKEDIVDLLQTQINIHDSSYTKDELKIALNALKFSDKTVQNVMTPKKTARFVRSDEPISTVLMSELHGSGFSRFPVYMDEPDNIVGTLYLKDLVNRRLTGKVFSAMNEEFFYIDEETNLNDCLKRFLKTRHHLFVVNNAFNEIQGVISLEDVIEEIIGKEIIDESDDAKNDEEKSIVS